ncbi:MAG: MMPL family transporter [Acidimicrobiales bacterium]|nr:MMPL family transporter [Acidimicrobiales bacterium]
MLGRLGHLLSRRYRAVLLCTLLAVPVLGVLGGGVQRHLSVGGFVDGDDESARVASQLERSFGTAAPNEVFVATALAGSVTDEANTQAGRDLVEELRRQRGVAEVLSPWTLGHLPPGAPNPLVSEDGTRAVLALRLPGGEDGQRRTAEQLTAFHGERHGFRLLATGPAEIGRQAAEQAERDLLRAELIAAPLTLVGLLVVFRGWRAALLPLGVALVAVLGTFCVLRLLASMTTVSVFALNLTTGLGLGLAVDYSLLLLARFREERGAGLEVGPAVHRTMQTAGRTVLFSAVTVALSLLALLAMPVPYLRSFAYAGVSVVAIAAGAALVVVPAALFAFGGRLGRRQAGHGGGWARQARRVMARPVLWACVVTAVLVAAGAPFLGVRVGRIDDRILPADQSARVAADQLRTHFHYGEFNPITVAMPWIDGGDEVTLHRAVDEVLRVEGVARVDSALGFSIPGRTIPPTAYHQRFLGPPGAGTWLSVTTPHDPDSDEAKAVVRAIRGLDPRLGVSGTTASVLDAVAGVRARAPLAAAVIALTTVVLLFVMTGSVVVPLKALALNLVSLTATFGALVWVFQDGHLGGLFGVTATGRLDVFTPILMFCVAFGLSMDYEVFLLAAIKEHYDHHGDNAAAVVHGLGRSGSLVTAAAALLTIVFVAIGTSGVATVKMIGLGLAVAVLIDAFLIRATLVPALMRLTGGWNWWAPRPLRRLHLRYGWFEPTPLEFATPDRRPLAARDLAVQTLLGHPMFARCGPRERAMVARHIDTVAVPPGALLTSEQREAPGLLVVLSGSVLVERNAMVLTVMGPGGSLGEEAGWRGGCSPVTAVAGRDTELACVGARALRLLARDLPLCATPSTGTPRPAANLEVFR